ncbi:hypothetical protein DCC39_04615 [Pueribacillus theae]|uniref:Uncharacterized protein n=1 Tax=Pueribacillus theae TaxID=2171751 RepID=A0A2U1K5R2_9BACI|nr:hypothetical protein [Pueribacillus theae]PWA12722.1 hypothetical protein DCC39_04615 [Pueribacillus theae]
MSNREFYWSHCEREEEEATENENRNKLSDKNVNIAKVFKSGNSYVDIRVDDKVFQAQEHDEEEEEHAEEQERRRHRKHRDCC